MNFQKRRAKIQMTYSKNKELKYLREKVALQEITIKKLCEKNFQLKQTIIQLKEKENANTITRDC